MYVRAISHSLGIHSTGFLTEEVDSDDENDDVNVDEQQQQQPSGPATSATAAADATSAWLATCEVCLLAPRDGVVLVPCGHSRFCAQCADAVAVMLNGCVVHLLTWLCLCIFDVYLANYRKTLLELD